MNSRDRANLEFLMNTPENDFDDWLETANDDDIEYALELIRKSKTEKMIEMIELQDLMAQDMEDMDDARTVWERIRNVGKI